MKKLLSLLLTIAMLVGFVPGIVALANVSPMNDYHVLDPNNDCGSDRTYYVNEGDTLNLYRPAGVNTMTWNKLVDTTGLPFASGTFAADSYSFHNSGNIPNGSKLVYEVNGCLVTICFVSNINNVSCNQACLSSLTPISYDRYTGNQGDSCMYNLDKKGLEGTSSTLYYRNGNVGVDGTLYENGFEAWIARWNFINEISWASITYDIDSNYTTLSGKTGLINSYNTTNFDTTLYFYGDDELLYSQILTASNYEYSFSIDVSDVNTLTVMLKDNTAAMGGTSFAIYDLFLSGGSLNESSETSKNDNYTQQHFDFVNSQTYEIASTEYRYAKTIWNNSYNNDIQQAGENAHDILEGICDFISFDKIKSLQNPYDAIFMDLLSSPQVDETLSEMVKSKADYVIVDILDDIGSSFLDDCDWTKDEDVVDNLIDLLITNADNRQSNKLYQAIDKWIMGKGADEINSIFSKYACFSDVLAIIDGGIKLTDYLVEFLQYTVSIEAYYLASEEFKAVHKEVADVMLILDVELGAQFNKTYDYGKKFNETYNNYSSCIDYNSVTKNVLKYAGKEGGWLATGLMEDILKTWISTFCTTVLKMSTQAVSDTLWILWAYKTGFNLGNLITNNDDSVNCRRMLRANYRLDEAIYDVMTAHANRLKSNPTYQEARYFDAAFSMFKNIQLSSLEYHKKFMDANGSSFFSLLSGRKELFKNEAEAQAAIINTWERITCHDEALLNSIPYSKSDTVVVACPTNVYVYRKSDGELVASVVDNVVYCIDDALTVVVVSDEKAICAPSLDDYDVKIEATDDGSMTVEYSVNRLERTQSERTVLYNDVALSNQNTFDLKIDSENNSVSLVDQNQKTISPDLDSSNLVLDGASLTVNADLTINLTVEESLFTENGYTNPYVVFSLNGVKTKVTAYTVVNGKYVFAFEDVIPQQMNETFCATLYATYDGVEYAGSVQNCSAPTYCYSSGDITRASDGATPDQLITYYSRMGLTVTVTDAEGQAVEYVGTGSKVYFGDVEYTTVLKGDISGDGMIDIFDLSSLLGGVNGEYELEGVFKKACLIVNEEEPDIFDLTALLSHVNGDSVIVA
ncbi:MAG: NPCBM/NEW2 domain-containing protein [Clostridia bacterium]|nr:NPCBM/NEW2 domain-containing protein [Clostridia bacterium]